MSALTTFLQGTPSAAATANGNGTPADFLAGRAELVEVVESNGGTCTLTFEGSFDGTNWYVVGFQPVGNQATLTRTVTPLSVTANLKQTYQILDNYPQVRARISSIAGSANVTVKLYEVT